MNGVCTGGLLRLIVLSPHWLSLVMEPTSIGSHYRQPLRTVGKLVGQQCRPIILFGIENRKIVPILPLSDDQVSVGGVAKVTPKELAISLCTAVAPISHRSEFDFNFVIVCCSN